MNELGGRIADPMFGSERPPESAEEVRRRDSLEDPYSWRFAAVRLRDYLVQVGHMCLLEHPNVQDSAFPAEEATAIYAAFGSVPSPAAWDGELLDSLEPVVPQFMIRLASSEVLALDPVVSFFPSSDVDGLTEIRNPKGWSRVGLLPGSASLIYLKQLPLFDPNEHTESYDVYVQRVLRDWLSVPLHLARLFVRRKQYLLVFLMVAFQDYIQRELTNVRGIPYPDLLRLVLKGALNPQS